MQLIKKVGATLVGSLMASSAILAGALAADLSSFQNMTTANTVVVVGANAKTADVVGAINVAAALARHGAEATVTGAGEVTKVTGGVALETENTKIYLGDPINKAKEALTADDLPNLLASGTVVDNTGTEYKYDQYLYVGNKKVTFGKPDDLDNPVIYIPIGTDPNAPLYTLKVVFNDEINFNSTDVQGNTIKLFGKEFTIGQGSTNTNIILYEASQEVTVGAGEETTVSINGNEYKIDVVGISPDAQSATIEINGKAYTKSAGEDVVIGNTVFHVKEINLYEVPEKTGNVVLTIGSKKVVLSNGEPVKVGKDENPVDGTLVTITRGSDGGVSTIEIKVAAQDTDSDFIKAGGEFVDPVFGFKVKLKSVDLKANRDVIAVSTSGDKVATVKVTDKKGDTKTIEWAYDNAGTLSLADGDQNPIAVYEGEKVPEKGYLIITQGGFTHLLKVTDISAADDGIQNDKVTLQDVFTGTTYDVKLTGDTTGGDDTPLTGTKVIDGYTYNFTAYDTNGDGIYDTISVKWNPVNETVVYPAIELKNGEKIAFVKSAEDVVSLSVGGNTETLVLPTGDAKVTYTDNGTDITDVYVNGNELTLGGSTSVNVGGVYYAFTCGPVGATVTCSLDLNKYENTTAAPLDKPAILMIEEKDNNDHHGVIAIYADDDSGKITVDNVLMGPPMYTTSDSDVEQGLDVYGTLLEVNTADQGKVTIYYPDEQVYYTVAVGPDPQFGGTVTAGNAEVTFPPLAGTGIAALDTEASTFKGTKNVILVGGPAANKLVAELAEAGKTPTFKEWQEKLQGKAIIQAIDNPFGGGKVAIIVAGWSADDTRAACLKLATEKLTGEAKMLVNGELTNFQYPFPTQESGTTGATNETAQ